MPDILRHHFAMSRDDFPAHRQDPRKGLSVRRMPVNVDAVIDRVSRIPWGWIGKDIYSPERLVARIQHPKVALYDLLDDGRTVGYALISPPSPRNAFAAAAGGKSVIEIENLALFPGEEGGGRGWQFFTLVMDRLYQQYDAVYWSQSSTNYPTLKDYYVRKGMNYLGADRVPDFRRTKPERVAAIA